MAEGRGEEAMISVENMSFAYEDNVVLNNMTLQEKERKIIGLWGRNGVGKTTLMKLLAGHMRPNHGTIQIAGQIPYDNLKAKQHLCYMQEDQPFSEIWSVRDALRFYSYFNPNWNQVLAEQLLQEFKLPEKRKTKKLSTGMKTALQLVIGLASQADVTILDEPTNGLDAGMRKKFYELLLESYDDHPRLIILSTHHIEEMQALLESIIVIHEGRILLNERMDELRSRGIWLTGESKQVDKLLIDKKVMDQQVMGTFRKVLLDEPYSNEWKEQSRIHGLSIEKALVQDYLLSLTEQVKEASL